MASIIQSVSVTTDTMGQDSTDVALVRGFWISLHWRHNDHDGVSNHQPHGCLLNRLFRRRSKKTSKLRVTGLCVGNSPGPVNSPHKWPVTRKMFPFDDVTNADPVHWRIYAAPGGDELREVWGQMSICIWIRDFWYLCWHFYIIINEIEYLHSCFYAIFSAFE